MRVIPFRNIYLDDVFQIQQQAFFPLFQKYHDTETNPFLESKDVIFRKYSRSDTSGYIFLEQEIPVGAVRVIKQEETYKISALAVLPMYQNRGIAQAALKKIEAIHSDAKLWTLDTLQQEAGNCHLYEKLGYTQAGKSQKINDKLTLVSYQKEIK